MHYYCLFCETQRCRTIAELIRRTTAYRSICPEMIQRKWVRGQAREVRHAWLPGYVFLYTEEAISPWFSFLGIIRCLGKGELEGQDLEFARMIERNDGVMGTVHLAEVGDHCTISDPAWEGVQGTVIRMDRGRKRCEIAFEFDNRKHTVWVGYEIVKKEEEQGIN